jgi:uncharacterized protein YkwD
MSGKFFAKAFAFGLFLCALCVLLPKGADALELRIRNDFGNKLNTVVVYYDDASGAWVTRGWYIVGAKSSKTFNFSTSKSDIYLFSSLDGSTTTWGKGDVSRVVVAEAFKYSDGQECPAGKNRRSVKFTKHTANNNIINYKPTGTSGPLANAGGSPTPLPDAGNKSGGRDRQAVASANIVNLINNERNAAGLPDAGSPEKLNAAARTRAREMTQKYDIDTRPDGRSYVTAIADNGLSYALVWATCKKAPDDNSLTIYSDFYKNEEYKQHVLSKDLTDVGVGIFKSGNDYVCMQVFCFKTAPNQEKSLSESFKELEESLKKLGDLF